MEFLYVDLQTVKLFVRIGESDWRISVYRIITGILQFSMSSQRRQETLEKLFYAINLVNIIFVFFFKKIQNIYVNLEVSGHSTV